MVLGHGLRRITVMQAFLDFGFVFVGIVVAVLWLDSGLPVDVSTVVIYAVLLGLTMLALNAWLGMYQRIHKRSFEDTRARAVLSLHLSIPVAYGLLVLLPEAQLNRHLLEITGMAAVFGMLANRVRAQHNPTRTMMVHRVLIIGVGKEAKSVADSLGVDDPSLEIAGYYPGNPSEEVSVEPERVLSREMSLTDTARALRVDEIIVAVRERRGGVLPLRELLDCRITGVKVMDLSSHFESMLGQIRIDALKAGWLIFGEGFDQGVIRTSVKRVFDCLCALLLLILVAPVMLVTAVLILLEDGGPVFYKQERVGFNGRLFNVIKFRSMRNDAESDGKPRWASANDDRVTRVGRFIRKVRIDELPQLYCVLKGDMSMVGPRPERPFFVDKLTKEIPFYTVRHSVKPGVTGWAQVRYHYGASVDDAVHKLQYDLYYVKNHTLLLDLVVLFETVGVVVGGKGAQ
jgi:sugar transferase (PEP-CTERM system associated)